MEREQANNTLRSVYDVALGGLPAEPESGGQEEHDTVFQLEASLKEQFERAFDADLSGVRIHTGAYAHQLTRNAGAAALTIGRDIYFQAGRFAPDTEEGVRLLAHEFRHVLQHQAGHRFVFPEDIAAAEAAADRAENALGGSRLRNNEAPLLSDDNTLARVEESGGAARGLARSTGGSTPSAFSGKRDKPLIRYYSRSGVTLDLTGEQYERGLGMVKESLDNYLMEQKYALPESEYETLVLRIYEALAD